MKATALVVALILLGGCMQSGSNRPEPVQAVLEAGEVTYDLRERPTRDDVGLEPGHDVMAIEHDGGRPLIDVTVVLPDEERFEVSTGTINITAWSLEGDGDPNKIELSRTFESVDDALADLSDAAEVLGLDVGQVQAWVPTAERLIAQGEGADPSSTSRTFDGRTIDDVQLSAEVTAFAATGRVGVSYDVLWGPWWETAEP